MAVVSVMTQPSPKSFFLIAGTIAVSLPQLVSNLSLSVKKTFFKGRKSKEEFVSTI